MIVSSRYFFLGAACLLAATIVACDKNQAAPSSTPSPSPAPAPAPAPAPGPAPALFTISGTVAETAPTTDRFIDGTRVVLGDRSVNTDSAGRFSLADVPTGSYTLRAEKGGYAEQTITFSVPADAGRVLQFNLEPQSDNLTRERSGTISQDNNPCHGGSLPCARYDFPAHHSGEVTASLLWSSSDATLRLEMRCGGEPVTATVVRGDNVSRNGEDYLSMDLVAEAQKGKICEIQILHVSGPNQNYVLVVTHPN